MDKGQSSGKRESAEKESTEGESSPLFISPISTKGGSELYDVFLSFNGSDTRNGFTNHLYERLVKTGILVFRDDESISIGNEFDSQILDAIKQSKISIPVISENYASSKWCLRELVQIMVQKNASHMVLPIFYKVKPSDVRYLINKFGDAFHANKMYFDKKDIEEGPQALTDVSFLNGWESENFANGREAELVTEVIKVVLRNLQHDNQVEVSRHLVGIDDHVKEIKTWVDTPTSDARMIGIYGMGGIGKTTLAKVIYNKLSIDFEHRSFLRDIRETANRNGIHYLQNQLIKEIQKIEHQVWNVDDGISFIKSKFKGKKVLILLDDVDKKDRLNALAGERNWFARGSMIIVTTRDKGILDQSKFGEVYEYGLTEMDMVQSLLLFNKHAFCMDHSPSEFEDISGAIVLTTGGLPLALELTGSYLYKKTDRKIWEDILEQLRKGEYKDVQKILKISFDALEDGHKEIFLDIACFFIGKDIKFAVYMWKDCGFYPSQGIEELKLRCLIDIGADGKVRMHDQMRDLGRSIIRQGQPRHKGSRLWVQEKAFRVLTKGKGTTSIQAICLDKYPDYPLFDGSADRPFLNGRADLQTYTNEHFKNLKTLRFLQLRRAALRGDFSKLRWLQWIGIKPDFSFLATNLRLPKLVVLQLSDDKITEKWEGWSSIMAAKRLKVLELKWCFSLASTPDLSAFTKLEILILKDCRKLEQVHLSICKLKSLISLDLSHCIRLKELPTTVGVLRELKELILDSTSVTKIPMSIGSMTKLEKLSALNCCSLRGIPNSIENLSSLQHLNLNGCTSLTEIPSSIWRLVNLQDLDLSCSAIEEIPRAIGGLKNLRRLSLNSCGSLTGKIPREIGKLSSLKILEITGTRISALSASIKNLSSLQKLDLGRCFRLQSLPQLPLGLKYLCVSCRSSVLPKLSCLNHLTALDLFRCNQLYHIPTLPSSILKLNVAFCDGLELGENAGFKYLRDLSIKKCTSFNRLDLSQLNGLKRLYVKDCYNLAVIHSYDHLKFLEEIVIDGCKSIGGLFLPELRCLKQLEANSCDNLVTIQGLERADFLEVLDIFDCGSIKRLPDLSCFATLKELRITRCKSLKELPNLSIFENLKSFTMRNTLGVTEIPGFEKSRSLTHIDITGCKSIEILPDLSGCEKLKSLVVRDCKKLTQLHGLEKLDLIYLDVSGCDSLEMIPELLETHVIRD